jgi:ribosomal protein S18 acetylase RimI-like enzyme
MNFAAEPGGIVFRHAIVADARTLVELAVRTYSETFSAVNTADNMQAYLSTAFTLPQFEADLANPRVTIQVAETNMGLIGYSKLVAGQVPDCVRGEAPIELERLYVDRQWHGSGVAGSLMERCLTEAKRRGFETIFLGVWEKNFRAQAFYRKWGFERVGEHIFQMGDDPQLDWWMERSI